jgi:hypothetical protein
LEQGRTKDTYASNDKNKRIIMTDMDEGALLRYRMPDKMPEYTPDRMSQRIPE